MNKCTNKVNRYDPIIGYMILLPKENCGGEMIVVGDIFSIESDSEGKIANKRTLYQCKICKTIQLI